MAPPQHGPRHAHRRPRHYLLPVSLFARVSLFFKGSLAQVGTTICRSQVGGGACIADRSSPCCEPSFML